MNHLHLTLEDGHNHFEPGATLVVTAEWELDESQECVELRLFWYTRGKGDTDVHIVEKLTFDPEPRSNTKRLGIQLPEAPYSFSGKLVSLIWALELVAEPSGDASRLEIVMAPHGREILLHPSATSAVAHADDESDS